MSKSRMGGSEFEVAAIARARQPSEYRLKPRCDGKYDLQEHQKSRSLATAINPSAHYEWVTVAVVESEEDSKKALKNLSRPIIAL